jgi:hypothetical protein
MAESGRWRRTPPCRDSIPWYENFEHPLPPSRGVRGRLRQSQHRHARCCAGNTRRQPSDPPERGHPGIQPQSLSHAAILEIRKAGAVTKRVNESLGPAGANRRALRDRLRQAERSPMYRPDRPRGRSEYSEHLRLADLFPIAVRIVPKLSPVVLSAHLDFQSFIHKNDGATVPLQGLIANHAGLQRIPTRSTGDEKNET